MFIQPNQPTTLHIKDKLYSFAQPFQERKTAIRTEIKQHKNNIRLLKSFAQGKRTLRNTDYSLSIRSYRRCREDERRMQWSIQQLNNQIYLLEKEAEIIQRYLREENQS